jgi:hypothetical protein
MARDARTTSTKKASKTNQREEIAMVRPAPVPDYVAPYTKRPVLRHNAGLFVDGGRGKGRGGVHVVPQNQANLGHLPPNCEYRLINHVLHICCVDASGQLSCNPVG